MGSKSFTTTPVALLGPALLAVKVKVTLLPTFGVALLDVFTIPTFDCGNGTVVTFAELLALLGSLFVPEIVATLVSELSKVTGNDELAVADKVIAGVNEVKVGMVPKNVIV